MFITEFFVIIGASGYGKNENPDYNGGFAKNLKSNEKTRFKIWSVKDGRSLIFLATSISNLPTS